MTPARLRFPLTVHLQRVVRIAARCRAVRSALALVAKGVQGWRSVFGRDGFSQALAQPQVLGICQDNENSMPRGILRLKPEVLRLSPIASFWDQ